MNYEDFKKNRAAKKRALDEDDAAKKAEKRQVNRTRGVMGFAHLMMFATFLVAAWSAFDLVSAINGVPTEVAYLAFAAVEGTWAACVLVMVLWQRDTEKLYQFDKANELANQAFWVSLVLNFAHGFTLVGVAMPSASWAAWGASIGDLVGGALAGVVLCVFPYMFKRLFAVLVTNQVEEARALNLGDALTECYERTAFERLNPAQPQAESRLTLAEPAISQLSPSAQPQVGQAKPVAEPIPAVAAETQLSQAKPAFGFSAGLSPQEAEKAKRVAETAKLMAEHPEYTNKQLADELGYSLASVKTYKATIRDNK